MSSNSSVLLTAKLRTPLSQAHSLAGSRNPGLDVARSIAILAVYVAHLGSEFASGASETALVFIGAMGVELFFALSGFLIGRLLIALAEGGVTPRRVGRFWARRWLRTLPLYYVVWLAMSWRFDLWHWRDLLFLQNFYPEQSQALVVSWSLVMEEFFYLLFPLFLLAATLAARRKAIGAWGVLAVALAEIVACNAARLVALSGAFGLIHDTSFHTAPLMRLDCAAYGVAAAALVALLRSPPAASRSRWSLPLVATCVVGFVAICTLLFVRVFDPRFQVASGFAHWAKFYFAFQYAALDAAFALLVVTLWRGLRWLPSWCGIPVGFVSRVSYSIYLVHAPLLAFWFAPAVARFGRVGGVALLTVAVLGASWLTWRGIERPFLALRDRAFPGRAAP
jgi:peptidoglycan/LPS O-acetylase OafA/YrhL